MRPYSSCSIAITSLFFAVASLPGGERQLKGRTDLQPAKTDFYDDLLPVDAVSRCGTTRFHSESAIHDLAFAPNGKVVASVSKDTILMWDVKTGRQLASIGAPPKVVALRRIVYSDDQMFIAVADAVCGLWVFNLAAPKPVAVELSGHKNSVLALAFSPDSTMLASAAPDIPNSQWSVNEERFVRVWDIAKGKQLQELHCGGARVMCLQYLGDGKHLAVGTLGGTLKVYDVKTGKSVRTLVDGADEVASLSYSRSENSLAAMIGGKLKLWRIETGASIDVPIDGATKLFGHAIARHGKTLAIRTDSTVTIIDQAAGERKDILTARDQGFGALAMSPRGDMVATTTFPFRYIRLVDTVSGRERHAFPSHFAAVGKLCFSSDGSKLVSVAQDATCRVWETATGKPLKRISIPARFHSADISSDAGTLVVRNEIGGHIINLSTETSISFSGGKGPIALSRDGRFIGETFEEKNRNCLRLLNAKTGTIVHTFDQDPGEVRSQVFSPDGQYIASGADRVRVWSVFKKELVATFGSELTPLFFSNDRGSLVTEVHSGLPWRTVASWNCRANQKDRELPMASFFGFLCQSDDRKLVAAADLIDGRICVVIRELPSCRRITVLNTGDVSAATFSSDKRFVATGGSTGMVLVWDLRASNEFRPLPDTLRPDDFPEMWRSLGKSAGYEHAIDTLVGSPSLAIKLVRERVRPIVHVDIGRLVADLGSDEFKMRDQAMERLKDLEFASLQTLERALRNNPSTEQRARIEHLLQMLKEPVQESNWLARWRAVLVLEQLRTQEARDILVALSRGPSEARLTTNAKAALDRMNADR